MTEKIAGSAARQKAFFESGQTRPLHFRITQLKILRKAIKAYEGPLFKALKEDLGKSEFESFATETGIVLTEIGVHLKNLRCWIRPVKVPTNQLIHFWSSSSIYPEPYGRTLIMAPWNYPFQLMINPLVGAISAGNCVTLKSSEYAPATSLVLGNMIREHFSPEYIDFFDGGLEMNQALLAMQWDYIFFTGSPAVGKVVMEAAARNLTPISLELGGKSPCIVDEDADLKTTAARIAWGKFLNAGQTCIAPDYLMVHAGVKDELLTLIKQRIERYYGSEPSKSPDYGRIATVIKTERLAAMIDPEKIYCGGAVNIQERYVDPTILTDVQPSDPVMQEEIFGPLLPVLTFTELEDAVRFVNDRPKPLALYYFGSKRKRQKYVIASTSSGGGCINDVVMHIANENLPFGGVGNSGRGRYHGKASFDTFSNQKSILKKSTLIDIPVRYAPYGSKLRLLKWIIR